MRIPIHLLCVIAAALTSPALLAQDAANTLKVIQAGQIRPE